MEFILLINGFYDLICAFNIQLTFSEQLKKLHYDLFDDPNKNNITIMLIYFAISRLSLNRKLAFISYIAEAFILYIYGKKNNNKVYFTIAFSLLLAYITIFS